VLANPSLARLVASWGIWVTIDAATLVILAVVAYTEGGVAAVGLVAAARILPRAIAGPWAAIVTDRYPRSKVMALAHAVCMLQLLALSAVVALHLSLLVVYALVVFGAVVSAVEPLGSTGPLAPQACLLSTTVDGSPGSMLTLNR
jgi:hypothetical protein